MSSNSIKVSPKHGVNPTIPICFWCGKEKNEVALLGKIDKEDSEAPRRVLLDYNPCEVCAELFSKGIHVIGVSETPLNEKMFPISSSEDNKPLYPTGAMFVAQESWIRDELLTAPEEAEMREAVLKQKVMLMPGEIVDEIVQQMNKIEASEQARIEQEGQEDENN